MFTNNKKAKMSMQRMMEKCKNCGHNRNNHGLILLDNTQINPFDNSKYQNRLCKKANCNCKKFIE